MIAKGRISGMFVVLSAALFASSLAGCGGEKPSPSGATTAAAHTTEAPAGGTAKSTAASTAASPSLGAAATAAATGTATAAPEGPAGRSKVPTQEEWTAAKEVGVKGSTKLGCETKMVREWLRVSCKGKNDSGGEPKGLTLKKGGNNGTTFTSSQPGLASLVVAYIDGVDLVAEFAWTDKKSELVVSWPHGAPEPPLKGEFR